MLQGQHSSSTFSPAIQPFAGVGAVISSYPVPLFVHNTFIEAAGAMEGAWAAGPWAGSSGVGWGVSKHET